jgi:2-dehydro-3-deoxyphosphogluconate aldolase / (4S)-4-hydroxy-2-oxoglutarate aldolase
MPQEPGAISAADLLTISPVVPVVVIEDAEHAVPLARALLGGGVRIIEVTLRTDAGLSAIERIAAEVPDIVVGAGTVTTPQQAAAVTRAGARFIVLPGSPERLLSAALDTGLPLLPAATTLTEMMRLGEHGITVLKFFPAEPSGGVRYLSAVAGPLPQLQFCPTGGISIGTVPDYLALPNVGCVGGSWLTPADAMAAGDWSRIESLAADAAATRPAVVR